jgi:hypothetical protein
MTEGAQLHPRRRPQVSHFKHVPLRTMVRLPAFGAGFADVAFHARFRPTAVLLRGLLPNLHIFRPPRLLRDRRAIVAHPFEMKFNRLADFSLRLFERVTTHTQPGKSGTYAGNSARLSRSRQRNAWSILEPRCRGMLFSVLGCKSALNSCGERRPALSRSYPSTAVGAPSSSQGFATRPEATDATRNGLEFASN